MKKVIFKWVVGDSAMPVLKESFNSFRSFFNNQSDLDVSYVVYYNGEKYNNFTSVHSIALEGAQIVNQHSFDSGNYPLPLKGCIWKEFPKIKMFPDAYEIYVDCDIILVNCNEILQWIYSPIDTILLYKNDSDTKGYTKGPVDAKPLVDAIRFKDCINQLNADLCAGFYGTPPGIEINSLYLNALETLKKDNPLWADAEAKNYGSDQGIFCFFITQFASRNVTTPFYILSYERHPFFSVTKGWMTKWIDLNNVEFVHMTGATHDWRSDRKTDNTLYDYIVNKINTRQFIKKSNGPHKNIKRITIESLGKTHIKGAVILNSSSKLQSVISFPLKLLYTILKSFFIIRNLIDRALNRKEIGQYEISLFMDVYTKDDILLFSISIDVKDNTFNFNPRIYYHSAVKIVLRNYKNILSVNHIT